MANSVFVTAAPDPFAAGLADLAGSDKVYLSSEANRTAGDKGRTYGAREQFAHVRRPLRGVQIKGDTYATLRVRTSDGKAIMPGLLDAGSATSEDKNPTIGRSEVYSNFLMQTVSEQRDEKMQTVLTFGTPFVFFYGEQPRMIQVQGVFLNTEDFNWRAEWWANYEQYLRGTKCVESKSRVYLAWDDIVVQGYIVNAAAQETSAERNFVTFNFTMILTDYRNISFVGDVFGRAFSEITPALEVDGEFDVGPGYDYGQMQTLHAHNAMRIAALNGRATAQAASFLEQATNMLSTASALASGVLEAGNAIASGVASGRALVNRAKNFDLMGVVGSASSVVSSAEILARITGLTRSDDRIVRVPDDYSFGGVAEEPYLNARGLKPGERRKIYIGSKPYEIEVPRLTRTPAERTRLSDNWDEFVVRVTSIPKGSQALRAFKVNEYLGTSSEEAIRELKKGLSYFGIRVNDVAQMNALEKTFAALRQGLKYAKFAATVFSTARDVGFAVRGSIDAIAGQFSSSARPTISPLRTSASPPLQNRLSGPTVSVQPGLQALVPENADRRAARTAVARVQVRRSRAELASAPSEARASQRVPGSAVRTRRPRSS